MSIVSSSPGLSNCGIGIKTVFIEDNLQPYLLDCVVGDKTIVRLINTFELEITINSVLPIYNALFPGRRIKTMKFLPNTCVALVYYAKGKCWYMEGQAGFSI
jgi:hypothetical protein